MPRHWRAAVVIHGSQRIRPKPNRVRLIQLVDDRAADRNRRNPPFGPSELKPTTP
jgi:hypothetical protein